MTPAQLAREVDAVVVVGGKNSANTRHLAEICRGIQPRTWHVETEDELRPEWFTGCRTVGRQRWRLDPRLGGRGSGGLAAASP